MTSQEAVTAAPPSPGGGRDHALDGLRGVAAFVVLVHHALLLSPLLALAHRDVRAKPDGVWWALLYSPLHALWNGTSAVWVFFVLSGYVLTPLAGRATRFDYWAAYYPRRAVRLYLPVVAAVALAMVWILLVPRSPVPGGSAWVNDHAWPGLRGVLDDLALFPLGESGHTASVLWSLRWEVWFSLLLPLFVLFGTAVRRVPVWITCVALQIVPSIPLPGQGHDFLKYLTPFACGVAIAVGPRPVVPGWLPRWLLYAVAVSGVNATWLAQGVFEEPSRLVVHATHAADVLASALLVALIAGGGGSALTRRVPAWLGSRSFSLYLVHEPIVVSAGLLVGARWWWMGSLVAVPLSLLVADLFWRLVEHPSIDVARRAGQLFAGRRAASAPA